MNLFKAPIMFSLTIDEIELLMDVLNRAESDLSGVADVPDRDDGIEGYAEYALITMHSRLTSLLSKLEDQSGLDWEFDVRTQRYFHVQDTGV